MGLAVAALLIVVGSSPVGETDGVQRPFVKALSQELRTTPPPMYPELLAATFHHRSDPTVALDLVGTLVAIPLCAQRDYQTRNQGWSGSRQRIEDGKVGMVLSPLLDLLIVCADGSIELAQELYQTTSENSFWKQSASRCSKL